MNLMQSPSKFKSNSQNLKKIVLNSIWKQNTQDRKTILNNKVTAGSINIPNTQLLYKGVVIKTP